PCALGLFWQRVGGGATQVLGRSLWLDAASGDVWEGLGEVGLKAPPVSLAVTQRQRYDLARDLVEVQRLGPVLVPAEQGTQPCDHIGGSDAIANGPPRGFPGALEGRGVGIQHPEAGAGVADWNRKGP